MTTTTPKSEGHDQSTTRPAAHRIFPDFRLPAQYALPKSNPAPDVTSEMKAWIRVLGLSVLSLLLSTLLAWPLVYPALLTASAAILLTIHQRRQWVGPDDVPRELPMGGASRTRRSWVLPLLPVIVGLPLSRTDVVPFAVACAPLVLIAILSQHRMRWEVALEHKGLPQREFWLPLTLLLIGLAGGAIPAVSLQSAVESKLGVIAFILAFAMITEGLGRTGYIDYLAYHIAERCQGQTDRLVLYFYLLASVITIVTSNDIVVLALTPIVVALAVQTRIRDPRTMLIFMFIGANTTSMLLIFGSPTNLIFAQTMGINGLAYTVMMIVPTIVAALVTYVVLDRIVGLSRLDSNEESAEDDEVAVTAVRQPATVMGLIRSTPLGIAGFGLFFFTLAHALAYSDYFARIVQPFLQETMGSISISNALFSTVASGLSVNVINDLPASALWAESLSNVNFDGEVSNMLASMGVLTGVNIGTYVTPIGALAGIIWLRLIRRELRLRRPSTIDSAPTTSDLVRTALPVFLVVSVVTALVNLAFAVLLYLALQPTGINKAFTSPQLGSPDYSVYVGALIGLVLLAGFVYLFSKALARRQVVFTHISEAFLVVQRLRGWAREHRLLYAIAVIGASVGVMATLLWQLERLYEVAAAVPLEQRTYGSLSAYGSWLVTFVGSGFENDVFPKSIGATVVASLMPLVGIGAIIYLVRLPDAEGGLLTSQLARGFGTIERTVIVGDAESVEPIAGALVGDGRRLFVFLHSGSPPDVSELGETHAIAREIDGTMESLVTEYDLLSCRELVITSSGSDASDHANLRLLGELVRHFQGQRGRYTSAERLPRVLLEVGGSQLAGIVQRAIPDDLVDFIHIVEPNTWLQSALKLDGLGSVSRLGEDLRDIEMTCEADSEDFRVHRRAADDGQLWVQVGEPELSAEQLTTQALGIIEGQLQESAVSDASRVSLGRYGLTYPGQTPVWHSLVLRRAHVGAEAKESDLKEHSLGRIHVVGASESSLLLVDTLLAASHGIEIFVHHNSDGRAVDALIARAEEAGNDRLHVAVDRFKTPLNLRNRLFPRPCEPAHADSRFGLVPGDKIYFFHEGQDGAEGKDVSEATHLVPVLSAISEALDEDIDAVNHDSIYMVMESHRESTRFVLRRLRCDWVLDTQQRRKNFYRAFAHIYLDRALDLPGSGQTIFRFKAAVAMAGRLQLVNLGVGAETSMSFSERMAVQVSDGSIGVPIPLGVLSLRREIDAGTGKREAWSSRLSLGESFREPETTETSRESHVFCSISL